MKNEQACGKKILAPVAAAIALSVGASAQFAGSEDSSEILEGQPIFEVSLEGDIRDGQRASRPKIVLSRNDRHERELKFKMYPRPGLDPLAVIPELDDMVKTLVLEGTPGGMAVIHLDTRAPVLKSGGGVRIAGMFDADGFFAVELPDDLDLGGLFAWGEQILEMSNFVKKPMGGSAVRPNQRPEVGELDLEEAAEQSHSNWVFYWTDLQLRNDARVSSASLEESASLLAVASSPIGTQRVADKIVLRRPRTPSSGQGHSQPGAGVEDDTGTGTDPVISDPADPTGGRRAGKKIPLQRPVIRHDHVLQHR